MRVYCEGRIIEASEGRPVAIILSKEEKEHIAQMPDSNWYIYTEYGEDFTLKEVEEFFQEVKREVLHE